jgi:prolyl oligopeptidase
MTSRPQHVETPCDDLVETIHGIEVADPYRWLEDGETARVQRWVAEQNARTRTALDPLPSRATWHERLVELMGLPIVQAVQVRGDRLFLLERSTGEQQARLVVRSLTDPASNRTVLVDPSHGSDDGAVAVDWFFASNDGELVTVGTSEGGTENSVLRVVRAADGASLADEIPNCRAASVAWEPDGRGFFYTRYPDGDEYHRTVHHHTLGAAWPEDPIVWAEHPTPQTWPEVSISPEGRFVLVDAMVGWSRSDQHLLDRQTGEWHTLIAGVDATNHLVFADEHRLIGSTTLDAPKGRIVSIGLEQPPADPAGWKTVVPERDVIVGVPKPVGGGLVVTISRAGVDAIEWWSAESLQGDTGGVLIEGLGVCAVAQLATDRDNGTSLALVTGFDAPMSVWRLDRPEGDMWAAPLHPLNSGDAVPDLMVSQVEYPSNDGTAIGLFLVHRCDVEPDAGTAAILNGYGGFAITETPVWSPTIAAWCEAGGLYAIAGLRGGYEHGEEWHQAGKRANKQNVFDDFHAAADWLVATGRTSRDRLAIAGGSNGGLLVGAALTQRPDLCRAVWCAVPLLDMIRFPNFLIARLWTDEYGDPDVAEEFAWLYAYSPYHHVTDGQRYPAVLLSTAEGDTRVDPLHARKMAAVLQSAAADQAQRPVLLHQEGRAGHGAGKPVGKRAAEQADVLAFFSWQLGIDP